jgi:RNA polymerase sigma factor (TIGR02999 family)
MQPPKEVTRLLQEWSEGKPQALEELLPLVHAELLRCARAELRRERPNHTLQPTALVNEAYLRLVGQRETRWENRAQFFAFAAEIMKRILVDDYRRRKARKRPRPELRVSLSEDLPAGGSDGIDLLWLNEALERLKALDPRQARIVVLRFFAGLSVEEAAGVMGTSPATVKREWSMAKAWLSRELSKPSGLLP